MEVDPAVLSLSCVLYPLPVDHGGVGQLLSIKSPRSSFLLGVLLAFFSL